MNQMREYGRTQREAGSARSIQLLRPFFWKLIFVVVLLGLLTVTDMAQPYFLKLLIDDVFGHSGTEGGNWSLLWLVLPGMGLIYVTRNTLFFTSRMMSLRISEDICFNLRRRLFDHLQQLSLRFYRANQPGKVSARVMDDTFKIQTFIQDKLPTFVRYLMEFQILVVIVYLVNWRLALASTIVLPLHFLTYRGFRASIRRSHAEAQESLAIAHGNIVEKFLGMEVVKGFSAEDRESSQFRSAIDASRRSQIRSQRFTFAQKVVADLIVGLGTVILLGYGAFEVKIGRMTGGEFFMFFWYTKMLYPSVLEVISGAGHLSRATTSIDRVFEILAEPIQDHAVSIAVSAVHKPEDLVGSIEYDNVCFSYDEDSPLVLNRVSFHINKGEHIALTGPSGSGKSTLMSLLPRFNEPVSGKILLNEHDISKVPIRILRKVFGIAFQDVFLFNTTIIENIRYARPEATMEEILHACELTGAHEFIQRLPDGYYTRIGEAGCELSRGEKQRITLARAIVRNPHVLILDEATASLDATSSHEIIDSILDDMQGKTVIMITHDTELLDLVDRVLTINKGRIVFDGDPAQYSERIGAAGVDYHGHTQHHAAGSHAKHLSDQAEASSEERSVSGEQSVKRKKGGGPVGGALLLMLMLCFAMLMAMGCQRTKETTSSIELENPRVTSGVLLDEDDPEELNKIVKALDSLPFDPATIDPSQIEALAASYRDQEQPAAPAEPERNPAIVEAEKENTKAALAALGEKLSQLNLPADSVRLLPLPDISNSELNDLLAHLILKFNASGNYIDAADMLVDSLPALPGGVISGGLIARTTSDGFTDILRLGYQRFISQPTQLWVMGLRRSADGKVTVNPDLEKVQPVLQELLTSLTKSRESITVKDLDKKIIQLSYSSANDAVNLLKGMGITTFKSPQEIPAAVNYKQLPYVAVIPDPDKGAVGLVGGGAVKGGNFGETSIGTASQLVNNSVATRTTQLLVMFHPARPDQFSEVRQLLDEYIDRPARQIFVEGLVLEISEDGLKDLGIEWELNEPPVFFKLGSSAVGSDKETLRLESTNLDLGDVFRDLKWNWSVKIRALIREGKAEILSRPSVLTLNNRQSSIRVGQDIPIATSQDANTSGTVAKLSFNFRYLSTGILLNIRPRINEDGSEVSMLIDTIVSAVVPGQDLEIRTSNGDVLASAPTVSSRRVQTYARIANNTPLIIGGLVSKEHILIHDKVPLLGDIPLVGGLFRSENATDSKREVIIVLTPYVLPEDRLIPRSLPKDEDYFDSFGHKLFRDAYRIRSEDVFDLGFLLGNKRFRRYQDLARKAIAANYRLASVQPFKSFADGRIPGEEIIVTRMIYEVAKRLGIADSIDIPRVIFFESQEYSGGYNVRFLDTTAGRLAGAYDFNDFFEYLPGKALVFTYYSNPTAGSEGLSSEPIPEMSIVDCPNRKVWSTLLWDLNQPTEDGRIRHSIVINNPSDLKRLKRALAVKKIVSLNGGPDRLRMREFSDGKVLLMPELKKDMVHVMDAEVAKYFFYTEDYYAAMLQEIQNRLKQLDKVLRGGSLIESVEDKS